MDDYTIQELQIKDYTLLDDIFKIYQSCFNQAIKIPQKEIRKYFLSGFYIINCIRDIKNNTICGFCMHMIIKNVGAIQIDYIAIKNNYQGKGLARILFNYIFTNYCKTKILTLECEDHLIEFYKKLGCILIPMKYEVGCNYHLNIMFKSNKNVTVRYYSKIVNNIKLENDYCTNFISSYTEKYINELKTKFNKKIQNMARLKVNN